MTDHNTEQAAARRRQVVTLTRLGWTARQIADHIGISMRQVGRHRVAAGVAQPPHRPLTGREILRAQELLDDGASYVEAARTVGRSDSALRRHIPGYTWDKRKCAEAGALVRAMNQLDKQAPVAVATGNRTTTKGTNAA